MGPNLVRGFAPSGIGPRDLTVGTSNDALGGSMYWGASVEAVTPLYFLPKEIGIKVGAFLDAGSVWGYEGRIIMALRRDRRDAYRRRQQFGAIFGRCELDLGLSARSAALRSGLSAYQGKLRPHASLPLQRRHEVLMVARVQS